MPAQLGVQASTDHQHVAVATAVYLTSVEIGGAVGSAISGAIWGKNIPAKLREYLPAAAMGDEMAIYNSIDVATGYKVGSAERIAIDRAYQETMRILLIVAICCCSVGAVEFGDEGLWVRREGAGCQGTGNWREG